MQIMKFAQNCEERERERDKRDRGERERERQWRICREKQAELFCEEDLRRENK